jgi:hypothetical protein
MDDGAASLWRRGSEGRGEGARRCREPGRWRRGGFDQIEDCRVTGTVAAWGLRSDGVRFPEHASADHFSGRLRLTGSIRIVDDD